MTILSPSRIIDAGSELVLLLVGILALGCAAAGLLAHLVDRNGGRPRPR